MASKMSMDRITRLLDEVNSALTELRPLAYLLVYLCLVPIFAFAYWLLPGAFYAPYARLEQSGINDQYTIGETLELAFRRAAKSRPQKPDEAWEIDADNTFVQRLKGTSEGTLTFDLTVLMRRRLGGQGMIQFPTKFSLHFGGSLLIHSGPGEPKFYRVFDIEDSPWMKDYLPKDDLTPSSIVHEAFNMLELTRDEEKAVARFFAGSMGDALAVSDSYRRMLYFSAIVITTVGFGDIVPMSSMARMLVAFEALAGIMVAGLFINAIAFRASHPLERPSE